MVLPELEIEANLDKLYKKLAYYSLRWNIPIKTSTVSELTYSFPLNVF
jgi:hypothetical protein